MQRTLNYTGRGRILKKQAQFSFAPNSGATPEFNVRFSIDPEPYPDASLYVEAYYKETRQRFDFGTVSSIRPPANRRLDEVDLSGPTLFRVLIVDESGEHGKLLARGDQFRADADGEDQDKSSILPVRKYNLGQLTWKVSFETDGTPELHLHSGIHNAIERVKTDPQFQSLILPAVFREILTYYLWNAEEAEENEHFARWMSFASLFAEEPPETSDPAELFNWIDEVIAGFSKRFHLADLLIDACDGG